MNKYWTKLKKDRFYLLNSITQVLLIILLIFLSNADIINTDYISYLREVFFILVGVALLIRKKVVHLAVTVTLFSMLLYLIIV